MLWNENQLQGENWKIHKYMETKQHATKELIGQRRNQRGNQKILRNKWKWKHNFPKFGGYSKISFPGGQFIVIKTYFKKQEKKNLTKQFKEKHLTVR